MTSGLGLSHAFCYALGATYQIPHGETSCMTLGAVIKLKAKRNTQDAQQIARLLPYAKGKVSMWTTTRDNQSHKTTVKDAIEVGDAVIALVDALGLKVTLSDYEVAESEVDVIVTRALGGKVGGAVVGIDEAIFQEVRALVESLYLAVQYTGS